MSDNAHTTKEQRDRVFKQKGYQILCARMYNDSKCWNSTRYCDHLMDNTKCSAFERIQEGELLDDRR